MGCPASLTIFLRAVIDAILSKTPAIGQPHVCNTDCIEQKSDEEFINCFFNRKSTVREHEFYLPAEEQQKH